MLQSHAISVPGRRSNNEDAVCERADLGLFVVCDGLGGYDGGEVASALAIETVSLLVQRTNSDADVTWPYKIDPARWVVENEILVALRLANDRIHARREGVLAQMGSTVALLRFEGDRVVIAHVGDSRVYRLRGGELAQLTEDHSLLNQLRAAGMAPDGAYAWRHVITRALGMSDAMPDVRSEPVHAGDVYLICSDGLYEPLEAAHIAALLESGPELAARRLVDAAYAAGSTDNISAVVIRC